MDGGGEREIRIGALCHHPYRELEKNLLLTHLLSAVRRAYKSILLDMCTTKELRGRMLSEHSNNNSEWHLTIN